MRKTFHFVTVALASALFAPLGHAEAIDYDGLCRAEAKAEGIQESSVEKYVKVCIEEMKAESAKPKSE